MIEGKGDAIKRQPRRARSLFLLLSNGNPPPHSQVMVMIVPGQELGRRGADRPSSRGEDHVFSSERVAESVYSVEWIWVRDQHKIMRSPRACLGRGLKDPQGPPAGITYLTFY